MSNNDASFPNNFANYSNNNPNPAAANPSQLLANPYRLQQRLGHGTFGQIFMAEDTKHQLLQEW